MNPIHPTMQSPRVLPATIRKMCVAMKMTRCLVYRTEQGYFLRTWGNTVVTTFLGEDVSEAERKLDLLLPEKERITFFERPPNG